MMAYRHLELGGCVIHVAVAVAVNDHVNDHGHVNDHAGSRLRLLTGSYPCLFAVTDRAVPLALALTFAPTVPLALAASATPRGFGRGERSIG